jgi:NET1-associated nuclear protein 1 (U3 small nucleolar RNA-associated protein 17)
MLRASCCITCYAVYANKPCLIDFWVARSTIRSRSEIPSHVSWSYDGSIMAVASSSYVVLYDPNTAVALRTIFCPECETVSSVCFIGKTSRYLVIRSYTEFVLWDLILENGTFAGYPPQTMLGLILLYLVRWHYQSSSTISQVFSHHRDETFVILESDTHSAQTKILKFTPTSMDPVSSHALPFRLISIAPCPPRWLMSNDSGSFAFVGITNNWNAVIFGDHIRLAESEEISGRGLVGAAPVTTQTLFQDIFGRSAFIDLTAKNANAEVPAARSTSNWKGKEVERIFDTPAYLMPPLATLFDSLSDEFLAPRTDSEVTLRSENDVEQQDDDVEMEGVESLIVIGNRLERTVDDKEMVAMIELFRNHGLHCKLCASIFLNVFSSLATATTSVAPTPKRPVQANGYYRATDLSNVFTTPTTNGIVKPNGITPKTRNAVNTTDLADVETPSKQSPATKAGQKRKTVS